MLFRKRTSAAWIQNVSPLLAAPLSPVPQDLCAPSAEGIEKYLASGMICGIGPVYAKKLLRAFGEKVFDVIEAQPGRLRDVVGIGPVRAGRITAAWAEQKAVREIMVFLHSIHGHEGRFQQTPPGQAG